MKIIIWICFLASLGSILFGLSTEIEQSQKLIGFGVSGMFFVVFPLFSYHRWKDKKVEDYMLTKENIDKMRENQHESKY